MSKWTKLISRIVRLETQREDHERVHELEEAARSIAVGDMNRRLLDHNEVLEKWEKDRAEFVEKGWFEIQHKEVVDRLGKVELILSGQSGRQGPISDLVKWAAALLALIIMFLIGHFSWK